MHCLLGFQCMWITTDNTVWLVSLHDRSRKPTFGGTSLWWVGRTVATSLSGTATPPNWPCFWRLTAMLSTAYSPTPLIPVMIFWDFDLFCAICSLTHLNMKYWTMINVFTCITEFIYTKHSFRKMFLCYSIACVHSANNHYCNSSYSTGL